LTGFLIRFNTIFDNIVVAYFLIHHHTRQLVTADWKVPSTLQISAGAADTEKGGARQVVASQLQADI